jgi:anaerobic selenocysteine-containing dehydrogenase
VATVERDVVTGVRGRRDHPVTAGHLCTKVQRYEERCYHPDRLLTPLLRDGTKGSGQFREASWREALGVAGDGLRRAIDHHGPTGVLPYSYMGTQGVLQGASLDRRFFHALGACELERTICYSAGGWGWALTYPPGWPATDIEAVPSAEMVIVWGANMISTHLHLWPFVLEARRRGATIVCVDPVVTKTARAADWHVQLRPGSDAALAMSMLHVIFREGLEDHEFLEQRCIGADELRVKAQGWPPVRAAEVTGLSVSGIEELARRFAAARPGFIKLGPGAQRHATAGQAFRCVLALPAVTGAWRYPGGGAHVHSAGGFPMAADVMERPDLRPPGTRRRVNMVQLGRALEPDGGIGALVVYNSNPAVICPDSDRVLTGLSRPDLFTVAVDTTLTETVAYADVVLPATTQLEHLDVLWSWGHRYLSLNRPAIAPRGQSAPNTEIFRRLANALGLAEPALFTTDDDLLAEYLAAYPRDVRAEVLHNGYAKVTPRTDPDAKVLLRNDAAAGYGIDPLPDATESPIPGEGVIVLTPKSHHFLNSTYLDHHRLRRAAGDPAILVAAEDAGKIGITTGTLVRLRNALGTLTCRAAIDPSTLPGTVVLFGNWWHRDLPGGRGANTLTDGTLTDLGRAGVLTTRAYLEPADNGPPDNPGFPEPGRTLGDCKTLQTQHWKPEVAALDRVPGGLGLVLPPRRCGPGKGAVGELVDVPLGVLLEPVVVAALRAGIAQAGPPARFIRGVVLDVALGGGPTADRAGAGGVPDLDQVLQLDAWVVAVGLVPVVAVLGRERVQRHDQVGPGSGGVQPPGAVPAARPIPAGGGEGEPGRPGTRAFPVALGLGPGAAVTDSVPLLVGDRHAPSGLRVVRGGGGQVAGQPGVDGPEAGQLAGSAGQFGQGGQRGGQGDLSGEPAGNRAAAGPAGAGSSGAACAGPPPPAVVSGRGRESLPRSRSR